MTDVQIMLLYFGKYKETNCPNDVLVQEVLVRSRPIVIKFKVKIPRYQLNRHYHRVSLAKAVVMFIDETHYDDAF